MLSLQNNIIIFLAQYTVKKKMENALLIFCQDIIQ